MLSEAEIAEMLMSRDCDWDNYINVGLLADSHARLERRIAELEAQLKTLRNAVLREVTTDAE